MEIRRIQLKNWRNFREADVPIRDTTYIIGANAMGKSNLLDALRFLRDIAKPQGGGLQKAVHDRGGVPKLRCLHARNDPEVKIEVTLVESTDEEEITWHYGLGFKPEGKGAQRILISHEVIRRGNHIIFERPNLEDEKDKVRLTQTNLEQIHVNEEYRHLASFFGETTYLHLVPQLLKYGNQIGGNHLEDDPFGQGFLERIAKTPSRTRDSRLKRIEEALGHAVPQFRHLRFTTDRTNGRPHLEALYSHYRPKAGWQQEDQFSDGTLRLIGLLWSLMDGDALLLLEEPELSLNDAIIKEIPLLMDRVKRSRKKKARQVIISTHSEALLSNPGIDWRGVVILEPAQEGTTVRTARESEQQALESGLSVAEVLMPAVYPSGAKRLVTTW